MIHSNNTAMNITREVLECSFIKNESSELTSQRQELCRYGYPFCNKHTLSATILRIVPGCNLIYYLGKAIVILCV